MIRIVLLVVLSLLMAGCMTVSPNRLGISQAQWEQYSPEQRQQITENYRQVQQTKNKTELVSTPMSNSAIEVSIKGGKAMLPPYTQLQPYQPLSFIINAGECNKEVPVLSNDGTQKTVLDACYKNYILYLDPSRYDLSKAIGSIELPYLPVWKRGFTYPKVTSSGLIRLTSVNISIKILKDN